LGVSMLTLERGLDTDEVLGMVVALSELTGVAGTLSVMAGDSSPADTDLAVYEVASSGVVSLLLAPRWRPPNCLFIIETFHEIAQHVARNHLHRPLRL
jgi:hypothetical protein